MTDLTEVDEEGFPINASAAPGAWDTRGQEDTNQMDWTKDVRGTEQDGNGQDGNGQDDTAWGDGAVKVQGVRW